MGAVLHGPCGFIEKQGIEKPGMEYAGRFISGVDPESLGAALRVS
jgi:hypothetical protein